MRLECAHFIESIREGKRPLNDGYNGLRVVEIVEAAQRSLRNGGALYDFKPHFTMNGSAATNGSVLSHSYNGS